MENIEHESLGLKIRVKSENDIQGTAIVFLEGYMDTHNDKWFSRTCEKIIDSGYISLIFEMSKFSFINSTGLGQIYSINKLIKSLNGEMMLCSMHSKVKYYLSACGVEQFIPLYNTLDEAMDSCNK